jgi:hypothetical protein
MSSQRLHQLLSRLAPAGLQGAHQQALDSVLGLLRRFSARSQRHERVDEHRQRRQCHAHLRSALTTTLAVSNALDEACTRRRVQWTQRRHSFDGMAVPPRKRFDNSRITSPCRRSSAIAAC